MFHSSVDLSLSVASFIVPTLERARLRNIVYLLRPAPAVGHYDPSLTQQVLILTCQKKYTKLDKKIGQITDSEL